MTFIVDIFYRELGYETRNGPREKPYHWRYRLQASSKANAEDQGVAEFQRIALLSSVGWCRTIVSVHVTDSADAAACA
jgi:hypothetical protein